MSKRRSGTRTFAPAFGLLLLLTACNEGEILGGGSPTTGGSGLSSDGADGGTTPAPAGDGGSGASNGGTTTSPGSGGGASNADAYWTRDGGSSEGGTGDSGDHTGDNTGDAGGTDSGATGGNNGGESNGLALRVEGNRILTPDGTPFHGRGANLSDTRSCNACTWQDPDAYSHVAGLNRWADELLDEWGANFVRFLLHAYPSNEGYRVQWQSVTMDPGYVADIVDNVTYMTSKPGVYVMVTLFGDPSIKEHSTDYDVEWPTEATNAVYATLAEALGDNPKVLFALTNEPRGPADKNPELVQRYLSAIDTIRDVEAEMGFDEHIVVVQAPQNWARDLSYFVNNPIQRSNVAYEAHIYNSKTDFDKLVTQPSNTLPMLIGEHGPTPWSTLSDVQALWDLCQKLEIPHTAWAFHYRCEPDMLQDTASDGCGLDPDVNYDFPRTDWGNMVYDYLQKPW